MLNGSGQEQVAITGYSHQIRGFRGRAERMRSTSDIGDNSPTSVPLLVDLYLECALQRGSHPIHRTGRKHRLLASWTHLLFVFQM